MAILAFISKFFMVVRIRMELEVSSQLFFALSFFVTVGFVYSRWRSTVTDGGCKQIHLTRDFFSTLSFLCTSHCGSRCRMTCLHKKMIVHMSSDV